LHFDEWDEAFLQIIGHQIASASTDAGDRGGSGPVPAAKAKSNGATAKAGKRARKRTFTYYRNDDCVFVDGEYLIRNVPGRSCGRSCGGVSTSGSASSRTASCASIRRSGLPPIKDNLESRLILLRKRLAEKCPDVRSCR
jgi:hypothetical protein